MSIASRIEAIEGHIEEDYNALERLGADLTNVDKNIENIASVVNDIYDKLSKVTGTGSDLSLTPTLKGALGIVPLGNAEQNGTPTPDNPQNIRVVTGDNQVVVCNKNLFNKSTISFVRGVVQDNETISTTNPYVATSGKISLKKGTYTFYNSIVTNWLFYIQCFQNGTRIYQTPVGSNAKGHTFTLDDNYDVHLQLNTPMGSGVSVDEYLTDLTNNAFLLVGEIATEPSYIAHQEQSTTLHLGNEYLANIPNTDYKDEIDVVNKKIIRKVDKIASYNGEIITTDYISTTGGLDTGALVYYALSTPTEETITDTTLINELNGLQELLSYDGTTNITITSNSNNAQMLVQVSALKGE